MTTIKITNHAYDKAKERLGWNKHTLERMAGRVYWNGTWNQNLKGSLKAYVDGKREKYPEVGNIRIYGHNIFFFKGKCLITLYPLPSQLIKYVEVNKLNKPEKQ